MHISIIDDEKILTKNVAKKLKNNGYSVSPFTSYKEFIQKWDHHSDLYIIDISLWDGNGFDIIENLRKHKCIAPIMIISWYEDSDNIIYGLNIGADDYLTKPFIPDELLARVHALLRRPRMIRTVEILSYKNIHLNVFEGSVEVDGEIISLSKKEFLILELFLRAPGKIIERSELIRKVWWSYQELEVSDNTINVTLSRIRKKFGENFLLETVYNHGFVLK